MNTVTLWCVCWLCSDHGNRQEWFTNRLEALRFVRREKLGEAVTSIGTVEIPTDPGRLAAWLNKRFWTDNG